MTSYAKFRLQNGEWDWDRIFIRTADGKIRGTQVPLTALMGYHDDKGQKAAANPKYRRQRDKIYEAAEDVGLSFEENWDAQSEIQQQALRVAFGATGLDIRICELILYRKCHETTKPSKKKKRMMNVATPTVTSTNHGIEKDVPTPDPASFLSNFPNFPSSSSLTSSILQNSGSLVQSPPPNWESSPLQNSFLATPGALLGASQDPLKYTPSEWQMAPASFSQIFVPPTPAIPFELTQMQQARDLYTISGQLTLPSDLYYGGSVANSPQAQHLPQTPPGAIRRFSNVPAEFNGQSGSPILTSSLPPLAGEKSAQNTLDYLVKIAGGRKKRKETMKAYIDRVKRNLEQPLLSDIITPRAINLTVLHGLDEAYSNDSVKSLQYAAAMNLHSLDVEELTEELLRIESRQRQHQPHQPSIE